MRCLALADALAAGGSHVRFVSRNLPPHLQQLLRQRGHELALLDSATVAAERDAPAHYRWLGTSQLADARDTIAALPGVWNWIVVDHYGIDARWETAMQQKTARVLAIDDLADRQHDCDLLLDQNLLAGMLERYADLIPTDCIALLGPRYALLREDFRRLRSSVRVRTGPVRRLLVLFGGADRGNHTEKVLRAIVELGERALEVDVVIGLEHPALATIEAMCKRYGFLCHLQTPDVAELMARADLAVGATGSTSWERCCLGLPAVCMTQAANQVPIARGLENAGAVVNLGDGDTVTPTAIASALSALMDQPQLLTSLSTAARELVDGGGVERVTKMMLEAA